MECSSVRQDLTLCEQVGFDTIELRFDMLRRFLATEKLSDIPAFFAGARLRPSFCNAIYLYDELMTPRDSESRRKKFMEEFRNAVKLTVAVGSPGIVTVPPFTVDGTPHPRGERSREEIAVMLRALSEIAEGLVLAFEPVGAAKSAIPDISSALQVTAMAGLSDMGLTVDICNLYQYREGRDALAELAGMKAGEIAVVHLCDYDTNTYAQATREQRCFCGHGTLPVEKFVDAVAKTGYAGTASVEMFRPEYYTMQPEKLIATAYTTTAPYVRKAQ